MLPPDLLLPPKKTAVFVEESREREVKVTVEAQLGLGDIADIFQVQ